MTQINASIVLYNNNIRQIQKVIESYFSSKLSTKLYLIDNSPDNRLSILEKVDKRIEYIFNGANIGYGAGHNIALKKSISNHVSYHIVLNPDLYFDGNVVNLLYEYMKLNKNTGNIMPKILYPDGKNQFLAKLLPTPFDWILRRFLPNCWTKNITNRFELRFTKYNKIMNVPFLSGCFMFLRVDTLKEIGLFDENIFMYMEDIDLNRRIHKKYKTIYYPYCKVYHEYERGSHKNLKLFKISIESSIKYFNKWGWFFDKDRSLFNNKILKDTNYE